MLKINGNAGSQQHLQTWLDKAEFMMDLLKPPNKGLKTDH